MDTNLKWEGPTHPYLWGMTYEIRDKFNRPVVRAQVLKGDLMYRKNLGHLMEVISALLNGEKWVEQSENGYKVLSLGGDVQEILNEVKVDLSVVQETQEPEPISSTVEPLEEEIEEVEDEPEAEEEEAVIGGKREKPESEMKKKKRGRPRKS